MLRALAIKELREVLPIGLLGLGTLLAFVAGVGGLEPFARVASTLMGRSDALVPFAHPNFFMLVCLIASLLAVALGFRQSAWENGRGVYQFLLYRPVRRETIFLTKLAVGLAVFLVCTLLPLLLFACWLSMPGSYPGPFEWSMTGRFWQACGVLPLLYGGAFLSGVRPAHWFGTRVLPLLGMVLPVIVFLQPWSMLMLVPLLMVLMALYVLLAWNICFVARNRDFS